MTEPREIDAAEITRVVRDLCIEINYRVKVIAFEDLQTEAVRRMELEDLPVWIVNDCRGRDFYAETIKPWRKNGVLPETLRVQTNEWAGKNGGG
jgi:Fumarase C-terminus